MPTRERLDVIVSAGPPRHHERGDVHRFEYLKNDLLVDRGRTDARSKRFLILRFLGLVILSVVVAGCGGGSSGGGGNVGGSEAGQKVRLSDLEISVGSKEFTEQKILGQIAIQALEAAGATV